MAIKKLKDVQSCMEDGKKVLLHKPASGAAHEICEVVLCRWDDEWVTWLFNRESGGFTTGHYHGTLKAALQDYRERGLIGVEGTCLL
ncbi:MAG: hypothetical protein ACYTFG_16620 [Planctomycetota bacterium]|jgi:hypothetical protein